MVVYAQEGHSINPVFHCLHTALIKRGVSLRRFDFWFIPRKDAVIYVHAPEAYFGSPSTLRMLVNTTCFILSLLTAKLLRCRVIWSVNNVQSHEGRYPRAERIVMAIFGHFVDGIIHMSQTSLIECKQKYSYFNDIPTVIIPHINFSSIYPLRGNCKRGRSLISVGENDIVILAFGAIRRYKGIDRLINAFKEVQDSRLRMVIAGLPVDQTYTKELCASVQGDTRVRLLLREIANDEVPDLFAATTLMCSTFTAILNSGSVMLALTFGCPVLAARLGSFQDLQEQIGPEWLRLYDGQLSGDILAEGIRWAKVSDRDSPSLSFADLGKVTAEIVQFFRYVQSVDV